MATLALTTERSNWRDRFLDGAERLGNALPDPVAIFLIGMLSTHAFDAGSLVFIPLAGFLFANSGRNPVLGLILGYVGCATGLAGNLIPGQYDALLFGITQSGARLLDPAWEMNPVGNWWFIVTIALTFCRAWLDHHPADRRAASG